MSPPHFFLLGVSVRTGGGDDNRFRLDPATDDGVDGKIVGWSALRNSLNFSDTWSCVRDKVVLLLLPRPEPPLLSNNFSLALANFCSLAFASSFNFFSRASWSRCKRRSRTSLGWSSLSSYKSASRFRSNRFIRSPSSSSVVGGRGDDDGDAFFNVALNFVRTANWSRMAAAAAKN